MNLGNIWVNSLFLWVLEYPILASAFPSTQLAELFYQLILAIPSRVEGYHTNKHTYVDTHMHTTMQRETLSL